MMRNHELPQRLIKTGVAATLIGTALFSTTSCTGNEHGADRTNYDIMPHYPPPTLEGVPTHPPKLPHKVRKISAYVCDVTFVDGDRVTVRPIVDDKDFSLLAVSVDKDGLTVEGIDGQGPEAIIRELNGHRSEDQSLDASNCFPTILHVRKLEESDNIAYALVGPDSDLRDGDAMPRSVHAAVTHDIVDFEKTNLTDPS